MREKIKSHELVHSIIDMPAMDKEQIEKSLSEFKEGDGRSRFFKDSIIYDPPWPAYYEYSVKCDGCGGVCKLFSSDENEEKNNYILKHYNALAEEFCALGYDARVKCYCEACVAKDPDRLAPVTFWFAAEGMDEPIISYPLPMKYDDAQYKKALYFLKGATTPYSIDALIPEYEHKNNRYYPIIASIIGPKSAQKKSPGDCREEYRSRNK